MKKKRYLVISLVLILALGLPIVTTALGDDKTDGDIGFNNTMDTVSEFI
ncbi:MAG: hypothetical protein E6929_00605 [Clostridium sp.]|nr:hypothetical protein [Clostridium sp.]